MLEELERVFRQLRRTAVDDAVTADLVQEDMADHRYELAKELEKQLDLSRASPSK